MPGFWKIAENFGLNQLKMTGHHSDESIVIILRLDLLSLRDIHATPTGSGTARLDLLQYTCDPFRVGDCSLGSASTYLRPVESLGLLAWI